MLAEARKVTISEDPNLPTATSIKIKDGKDYHAKRVKVHGWVHRLRRQGEFVTVFIPFCILTDCLFPSIKSQLGRFFCIN